MTDVQVKRLEQLESWEGKGQFIYAGKSLGVGSFGMNVLDLPASWPDYPAHDHEEDGHEEVYVVLRGDAELRAGTETWRLEPGVVARVGPGVVRKLVPGKQGALVLALGGSAGQAYVASWGRRAKK